MSPTIIREPGQLTDAWLSDVLGRPGLTITDVRAVGTGQMSQSHRVRFEGGGDGPSSVVVKLASEDPTSRATGVGMGAYAREIAFYTHLAGRLGGPLPHCHLAAYDDAEGWFTLVLEDVEGGTQGDQIAGCTVDEARTALAALARVQAPVLGDLHVGTQGWLNQPSPLTQALIAAVLPGFLERYAGRIDPEHAALAERFAGAVDAWAADRRPPLGLVHGDFRLDNLLFTEDGCVVVDWQTVSWGPAMLDASYFLGGGLEPELRRAHEEELMRGYHAELLRHGADLDWETCWAEYRRQVFHNLLMAIAASMVTQRTDRGDDMFMAVFARSAQQAIDLGSADLLPAADAGPPPALRPEPADEGCHTPGPEQNWNESWYFDAISDDGTLGAYVRLGRLPNQGVALYTAAITGTDRPSVMLVDAAAPLPDADDPAQRIARDGLVAEQHCEEPLQRFRVTVTGTAASHADHAAPLRAEDGEPVEVALDLTWTTTGVPYRWRPATRYEIPCRVSGTIRVGDEELTLEGPGQRDHSWGSRDWWASDWMWSAMHLDDGTHTHLVTTPAAPGMGVGYVQQGDEVREIQGATSTAEIGDDGLPTRATLESGPDPLTLDVEPLAFGALRLEAPDGRLSLFPRAMARVGTPDGRTGLGWIEWNRIQQDG